MKLSKKEKETENRKMKLKKKGEEQDKTSVESEESKDPGKKHRKKKIKDETYVMKKNLTMKMIRFIFWFLLICVFVRGAYQIIRPQKADELNKIIRNFREEQNDLGSAPEEVMEFAQDFANEYLTYEKGGEKEYRERINPYLSKRLHNAQIYTFKNTAKAIYVNAYRREEENGIYNVYIKAEIEYQIGEEGITYDSCTLKVPVVVTDTGYCVTSLPMYVQDQRQDTEYVLPQVQPGQAVETALISSAVENFLDAYYTQEQSMVNYLLSADADRSKFISVKGRYTFVKADSLKAYQNEGSTDIICVLTARIKDKVNQEEIGQEYMITLVQEGDKYYVKDMSTMVY